jgi:hypothetical protein
MTRSRYGDVILSDKSHHFSLTSFGATGGGRQLGPRAVSRGTRDSVQHAADIIRLLLTTSRERVANRRLRLADVHHI